MRVCWLLSGVRCLLFRVLCVCLCVCCLVCGVHCSLSVVSLRVVRWSLFVGLRGVCRLVVGV